MQARCLITVKCYWVGYKTEHGITLLLLPSCWMTNVWYGSFWTLPRQITIGDGFLHMDFTKVLEYKAIQPGSVVRL